MTTNTESSVTKSNEESVTRPEVHEDTYVLPRADIFETPEAFVVMLDMPGAEKEKIRLRLERGSLMVSAPVAKHFQEGVTVFHEGSTAPGFARVFSLGEGIDLKNVDAQFDSGVLTIKLFKNDDLKPREISIR